MNKKGNTLALWIEIILFIVLFLAIMGIMGGEMNTKYGKNYDLSIGLNLSSQWQDLQAYRVDMANQTTSGQTSITDFGILKIMTTPALLLTATSIIWSLVSGTFIYNLVGSINWLGAYAGWVAGIFQVLYVIAIGFILIKLVLRISP